MCDLRFELQSCQRDFNPSLRQFPTTSPTGCEGQVSGFESPRSEDAGDGALLQGGASTLRIDQYG